MWKNLVESDRPKMTIRRMCVSRWIPKATDTHSEYVMLIAFSLQQRLHELAPSVTLYYIGCLVTSMELVSKFS